MDLLGINDFHGRIDANFGSSDDPIYAAVQLAAAVEQARAANEGNTFFVGAGDLYAASTFTSMAGDEIPTTDILGAIGMDASAVGNHEFDFGFQNLLDRINGVGDYDDHEIAWEYLGANVVTAGTDNPELPEYHIIQADDGIEIALIGLVTPETPSLVSPGGIAGLEFSDPAAAVDRVVANNPDVAGADAIVVLHHDGAANAAAVEDTSTNFGSFVAAMADRGDIAAVFSGHTHVEYEVGVNIPASDFATNTMWVVQTGQFADNLGRVSLDFEIDDDDVVSLVGISTDMIALKSITAPAVGENDVVDDVRDLLQAAIAEAASIGEQNVGVAGADLRRATHTDPETGAPAENRGGESTLSNLIADAQLWAVHEQGATQDLPVIAFMNPGGVRTDISAGPVTYMEVAQVQPFANSLFTFDLTGAQIKQVLEEQWQPEGASRPFLKLGVNEEFFYTYDPEGAPGERILEMFLAGEPIDLDATYRVVSNNFLAEGGDNFFTLEEGENYADTGIVDLQAFVDYFGAHDVVNPGLEQRAVGVHWVSDLTTPFALGSEIEVHLSSLIFSNDEADQPTRIIATLVGPGGYTAQVGTFAIDSDGVPTTDEIGRAVVATELPSELPAGEDPQEWELVLTNDVSDDFELRYTLLVVAADGAVDPGDGGAGAGDDGAGDGALPDTGSDVTAMLITTAILLAIGGTALGLRRRYSTQ